MAELYGLSLATHLDTILAEVQKNQSIYGYPLNKVFQADRIRISRLPSRANRPLPPWVPLPGPTPR